MKLVITGVSGYIGRRLVELARTEGHQIVTLGRTAPEGLVSFSWALGEEAPMAALAGADAVIHLAHSWAADSAEGENLNAIAGEKLARQALAAGVPRFVFASTTSARPTARNRYGRIKHEMEERFAALPGAAGRLVSARIALVYGGVPSGQYALMRKLTALTPVLPMFGLDRQVQPIHLDEVARGLLALAARRALTAPFYVLAGSPIRFAQWLKLLRKVQTGGNLILIPIPLGAVLSLCRLAPFLRERVLGLAGAEAMAQEKSLEALGLVPGDPFLLLCEEKTASGDESEALLRYLGVIPTAAMIRDLKAGLARAGLLPLGLSPAFLRRPRLIALVEPPARHQANRLARALHLASQVIEAHGPPAQRPSLIRTGLVVLIDLLFLPLRLIASRRFR
jgi:nucleoside-diphosphate-sugar epimerase